MRDTFLPFALPLIEEDEIREVVDSLKSGWITTGPKTKEFEEKFREALGCRYAIAVNSCTAALHLSLIAAGVGEGDEVITTPFTFCATANVIVHAGATPVFADIAPDVFNIDPDEVRRKITDKTRAIIPVHYGGHPCDMDEIVEIAREHDLLIIEDAAHAPSAEYKGRQIGTIGDLTCFSFYATKNLTTAEGGMITTDDKELAEKLRMLSLHGLSRGAWSRYSEKGSWYYEVLYPGYKYNMTDIQAALGLHQLAKLNDFQQKREEYVSMYDRAFGEMPEIETPKTRQYVKHAWHLYPILINSDFLKIDRGEFIEALKAENIGTSVHFIPLHLHPYYQQTFDLKRGDFPVTEQVYDCILSLPLYPKMTEDDVEDVIIAVKRVVGQNQKRAPKLAAVDEEKTL